MFVHACHFRVLLLFVRKIVAHHQRHTPALLLKTHLKTVSKWFVSISFGLPDICYLRVWKLGIKGSFVTRWMGCGTFGCRSDARTQIFTALEYGADVLFDLHSLATEERKGTEGRDDRPAWPAGCGGRARVRRCAHLRVVQRHFRPCNGSFGQGDHLAGYRCVVSLLLFRLLF